MAVIAFAAAGAAVGSAFGATALGLTVGAMAGSYFNAPEMPPIEGPRLADLSPQSADYGGAIPKVWGTMRVGAQVIGSSDIIETKHEEEYGGKGGPSYTQTTYTYAVNMAVAISEGEITAVRNIYANGQLIWTGDLDNVSGIDNAVPNVKIYTGTESQNPDPTLESIYGSGNVPAYRGVAYIVFTNFQLAEYGNSVPQIEVEVVVEGTSVDDRIHELVDYDNGTYWEVLNAGRNQVMQIIVEDGISQVYSERGGYNAPDVLTQGPDVYIAKSRVGYFASSGEFLGSRPYNFYEKSFAAWNVVPYIFDPDYSGFRPDAYLGSFVLYNTNTARQTAVCYSYMQNKLNSTLTYGFTNGDGDFVRYSAAPSISLGPFTNVIPKDLIPEFLRSYDGYLTCVSMLPDLSGLFIAWGPTPRSDTTTDTEGWAVIDQDGNVTRQGTCGTGVALKVFGDGRQYVTWESPNVFYVLRRFSFGVSGRLDAFSVGPDDVISFLKSDGSVHIKDGLNDFPRGLQAKGGVVFVLSFENFQVLSRLPRVTSNAYPVADILTDACSEGGLQTADLDVSAITDSVRGYARPRSSPIRGVIEPLQKAFFFDVVESDWQLKFVPRGGSSVVSIPEDDLCANLDESSSDDAVTVTRKQDMELPFEIAVKYLDSDFDYQLPMALTADKAIQVAEVMLYNSWLQRNTFSLKVPPKYEYLDPGDVVTVTENSNVHVLRITESRIGDFIELEAIQELASVYDSSATGLERTGGQSLLGAGPTLVTALDIPLLRTVDNTAGYYLALSGFNPNWYGASWYESLDQGTTFNFARNINGATVQGPIIDAELSTTALPGVIDYVSSITVGLGVGTVTSITDAQLLDGVSNAAAIGKDGQWELIQFQNATLNADGTYTLDTFIRGRKGTEWAIELHDLLGEQFVLLSSNLTWVPLTDPSQIGVERYYKAVTYNKLIENAPILSLTPSGVTLKPYSPSHLKATDNGDGTFTTTWIRRNRVSGEWRDGVGVPMSEETELYRVNVVRAGTQISTTDVSTETATVTATTGDVIQVAQVSAIVGAGYYSEITV